MWFSAVFNSRFKSTLFYRLLYFFLFPVPFNFILYDICKSKYRKGAVHLSILYLCNMAAAVLLQCAGIIDIFRILPITHLIMLVNVIYTVTLIRYESIKLQNEAARHFKYQCIWSWHWVLQNLLLTISGIFNKPPLPSIGNDAIHPFAGPIQVSRFYDHYLETKAGLPTETCGHGSAYRYHESKCL